MSVLREEDIVNHSGDVYAALEAKKVIAAKSLKETGSLPSWWENMICVGKTRGVPPKFPSADAYFSQGWEYFEGQAEKDERPTITGLQLHLGFTTRATMEAHVRRHPDFRGPHGIFMSVLQMALEETIDAPGGQAGKIFLIKNIPDGLAPDDTVNVKMSYSWQDKKLTELTGAGGGPLEIRRDLKPEDAYMQMLDGGVLEKQSESDDNDPGVTGESRNA